VGDVLQVKVIAIDEQDRVKLSHRAAVREQSPQPANSDGSPE
jgi:predicted RNA-binding protein with RPS1 domain